MSEFMKNVSVQPNGCWLWIKRIDSKGYGIMYIKSKQQRAHRVSYDKFRSKIPAGMMVCHSCDVRNCVNPAHLFLGTAKDNYDDAIAKGRQTLGRPIKHPSVDAYRVRKCRCSECIALYELYKEGHRAYERKKRQESKS